MDNLSLFIFMRRSGRRRRIIRHKCCNWTDNLDTLWPSAFSATWNVSWSRNPVLVRTPCPFLLGPSIVKYDLVPLVLFLSRNPVLVCVQESHPFIVQELCTGKCPCIEILSLSKILYLSWPRNSGLVQRPVSCPVLVHESCLCFVLNLVHILFLSLFIKPGLVLVQESYPFLGP